MTMTLGEAIRAKLLTLNAVTLLVGDKIRPDQLAQSDRLPAILISVDEEEPQNDLDGHGGLVDATVTISAIDSNATRARQLAEAIRSNNTNPGTGLAGFTGLAGDVHIDAILNRKSSDFLANDDGSEGGVFSIDSIYTVWYSETV